MSKPKNEATFLHHHWYDPGDICHWKWGRGFKASFCILFSSLSHTASVQIWASRPREGIAGLTQLLQRLVPQVVSRYSAGSRIKHEAISPGLAGVTLWPAHWPFHRFWPQAYRSSCPFPLTFQPPVQDQVSPHAKRRSVLSCHSSRSTLFGFIIKPFSWQLPKALIATSTSCDPWFPDFAGPEQGPSFPLPYSSLVQANLPSLAYLPLLQIPNSSKQSPSSFKSHDLKTDINSFYFLISLFTFLCSSYILTFPPGEPRGKLQLTLHYWLSFPDLSPKLSLMRLGHCARLPTWMAPLQLFYEGSFSSQYLLQRKLLICWWRASLLFLPLNVILMKSGTGLELISFGFPCQAQGWHIVSTRYICTEWNIWVCNICVCVGGGPMGRFPVITGYQGFHWHCTKITEWKRVGRGYLSLYVYTSIYTHTHTISKIDPETWSLSL